MRSSIAVSSAIFAAVAMAQGYDNVPAPADGRSTTVVPQEYQTYVPEPTTLCVDTTSTITVTCPTTITLTRMQTLTWSEYATTSCDTELPEETTTECETDTETLPPCPESTTMAYVPATTGGSYPTDTPVANSTEGGVPVPVETGGYVNGAGRSTVTSGALLAVVGVAAFFL